MNTKKTVLFDFDGVIVDTEPIYDIFWDAAAEKYQLGIANFASVIKGTIMPDIMQKYFSGFPQEVQDQIISDSAAYEANMDFPVIPGALEFIQILKKNNIQIGLVTSSDDRKVNRAFNTLSLHGIFDTIVTADRITLGKPNPMCYKLGAADLQTDPAHCLVFEDSFAGIQAATSAGMRVIGVSSTLPAESLKDKVYDVIPNFSEITFEQFKEWY